MIGIPYEFFAVPVGDRTDNKASCIYNMAMPAIDDWNEKLRCPKCGRTGVVSLSQIDDDMPTVLSITESFKAVQTEHGPDFRCGTCDIAVDP
jgi:hypothetical protein